MSHVNLDTSSPYPVEKGVPEESGIAGLLTDFADHLPEHMPFSGVLAIQVGNELVVDRAFNPVGSSFTTDQTFNCFSTGKIFTAVAAMQLVEEGQLDLDAPVDKYLSSEEVDMPLKPPYLQDKPIREELEKFKKNLNKITVRDLLNHRSGLVQAPGGPPEKFFEKLPGEIEHPYSNYGYQLLAVIIGKQTKNSKASNPEDRFRDHVEQRIFYPSGIKVRSDSIPPSYAIDHTGQLQLMEVEEPEPYPHGNGCWKITSKDLIAFSNALNEPGKLICNDSFDKMLNSIPPLGFDVDRDHEDNILGFGHPGASPYGTAFLYTFINQEKPITVAVLSNCPSGMDIKPALSLCI